MSAIILTQHNDNFRTGANLQETKLHTGNVNKSSFGKLFELPVDGQIYAQPLYVPEIDIQGYGKRNVVYVATMHNSVYGFDADRPGAPLWQAPLGPSIPLPNPSIGPPDYKDIECEIGVLSTPVISPERKAIYVVAASQRGAVFAHHLHALDLSSGKPLFGGPREITASIPGNGSGSAKGVVPFSSNRHNQRPGLLLANGVIYIAFASYGDQGPYHGWVFGYSADTLQRLHVFNATPEGEEAGIWQAGQGPCADDHGNIYVMTGNGTFSTTSLESRVTLADSSAAGPALAVLGNQLVMAWTSAGANPQLNLAASSDGRNFGPKVVLNEHAIDGPALAEWNGRLMLAWTGTDERQRLNIMSTSGLVNFQHKVTFDETSGHAPAMAAGNGRLFLAWTGTDDARSLNVMSSADGVTFQNKVTLPETSTAGPALSFFDGKLYLAWIATADTRAISIMESIDGVTFQNKVTLVDSSDFTPALMKSVQQVLLVWAGRDDARSLNLLRGASSSVLRIKDTYDDQGACGPAMTEFLGRIRVGWTGTDAGHHLNVACLGAAMLGDAFIKLRPDLTVADWFSPFNTQQLNQMDADLGSGGVLVMPGTKLVLGGGKEGKLYLLDRDNLGKFDPAGDQNAVQAFQAAGVPNMGVDPPQPAQGMHHIHGSPVYWNSANRGPMVFVWAEADFLRGYHFNGAQLDTAPADISSVVTPAKSMPGAMLSISAHASEAGSGIIWASHPTSLDANHQAVPGMLRAMNAENLRHELWNSEMYPDRDRPGSCSKFSPPTVAGGRVYLPTFSGKLVVYGLL